jgi:hypothetical protein
LLLWHWRLLHASLTTIHNLCHQTRRATPWGPDDLVPLHEGRVLPCTYNVPDDVCDDLLCEVCENAKAFSSSSTC